MIKFSYKKYLTPYDNLIGCTVGFNVNCKCLIFVLEPWWFFHFKISVCRFGPYLSYLLIICKCVP
uniref:Uncharacterized protein n=1 Tax=Arundo donax TaxID=35708 RepID=A0A0A9ELH7_ARUDO